MTLTGPVAGIVENKVGEPNAPPPRLGCTASAFAEKRHDAAAGNPPSVRSMRASFCAPSSALDALALVGDSRPGASTRPLPRYETREVPPAEPPPEVTASRRPSPSTSRRTSAVGEPTNVWEGPAV